MGATNLKETEVKRRFAELVGRGALIKEAALAVGISESTGKRWRKDGEVSKAIREVRESIMSPTVRSILGEALTATKRDGTPDFQTRLKAAQLLLTNPDANPELSQTSELPPGSIVLYPE